MANKYDLKTWIRRSLVGAAAGACVGSDTAATGKTRFLTYIRVNRKGVTLSSMASLVCGVGSVTTSAPTGTNVLSVTGLKLHFNFPALSLGTTGIHVGDSMVMQEVRGSIEHPIVSVAGGTYMGVAAGSTAGQLADVFATYYDE